MAEACASVVAVLASDDDAETGRITCGEIGDHLIHRAAGQDDGCAWTLYWTRRTV
jgi:hypothetical protein